MEPFDKELEEKYLAIEDKDGWWKSICSEHPHKACETCEHRGPIKELSVGVEISCRLATLALERQRTSFYVVQLNLDIDPETLKDYIEEAHLGYQNITAKVIKPW